MVLFLESRSETQGLASDRIEMRIRARVSRVYSAPTTITAVVIIFVFVTIIMSTTPAAIASPTVVPTATPAVVAVIGIIGWNYYRWGIGGEP